jgi:DNA replication protein DnaC
MHEPCSKCDDSGVLMVERGGSRVAQTCSCQMERRQARRIALARIPERYAHCTLEEYIPNYAGNNKALSGALVQARNFVKAYPLDTYGNGLLLTGSIGVGKTHLAVGILQALVAERGATGLFCDYRDLLKQVQNSYNRSVEATELEVLRPVFEAEVLVLDELGAAKPTDWVWDTVAHILNTRYNDRRTTIITTNYPNLPPGTASAATGRGAAREAMREESLGDRIGERMRSRLQEMCVVVEMHGQDFRQTVKRATFA